MLFGVKIKRKAVKCWLFHRLFTMSAAALLGSDYMLRERGGGGGGGRGLFHLTG